MKRVVGMVVARGRRVVGMGRMVVGTEKESAFQRRVYRKLVVDKRGFVVTQDHSLKKGALIAYLPGCLHNPRRFLPCSHDCS